MSEVERKMPLSSLEQDIFLNILHKYDHMLSCKKTNATSAMKKKQCWEQITHEFNASDIVTQKTTKRQLTKMWYYLKAKARESKTSENVRFLTGGSSVVADMDSEDNKVIDIDKNILTNIKEDIDSDVNGTVASDNYDHCWGKVKHLFETQISSVEPSTSCAEGPSTSHNVVPTTSHQLNTATPSIGALSKNKDTKTPIKRSFGGKYFRKINFMKLRFLEEELSFKQREHQEKIQMKIMEREHRKKILEAELNICLTKLKNENNKIHE